LNYSAIDLINDLMKY